MQTRVLKWSMCEEISVKNLIDLAVAWDIAKKRLEEAQKNGDTIVIEIWRLPITKGK